MIEQFLRTKVRDARNIITSILRYIFSTASNIVWDFEWWTSAHEDAIHSTIDSWRWWAIPWPLSIVWDWLISRLHDIVGMVFLGVHEVATIGIRFVNGMWDYEYGDWNAVSFTFYTFIRIEEAVAEIGWYLDHIADYLKPFIEGVFGNSLDFIGWAICEARMHILQHDYNEWDWIKSVTPNLFEGIKLAFIHLGLAVWDRVQQLLNLPWQVADWAIDTCGWGLGWAIQVIQNLDYNPWEVLRWTRPSKWEAFRDGLGILADRIKQRILSTVLVYVLPLQDRLDSLDDAFWSIFNELKDFANNPIEYIFRKLEQFSEQQAERLLNAVIRFLERIW